MYIYIKFKFNNLENTIEIIYRLVVANVLMFTVAEMFKRKLVLHSNSSDLGWSMRRLSGESPMSWTLSLALNTTLSTVMAVYPILVFPALFLSCWMTA